MTFTFHIYTSGFYKKKVSPPPQSNGFYLLLIFGDILAERIFFALSHA